MADAHSPKLSQFSLSETEKDAINLALKAPNPWKTDSKALRSLAEKIPIHLNLNEKALKEALNTVKNKLLSFHMKRQKERCCYCGKDLKEASPFERDREHILPKSKFRWLTYDVANISVSCKRCNMSCKHEKLDFIVNVQKIIKNPGDTSLYKFIHPNFEKWDNHLSRLKIECKPFIFLQYSFDCNDPKAKYNYEFFRLKEIETTSKDIAQGKKMKYPDLAEIISLIQNTGDWSLVYDE